MTFEIMGQKENFLILEKEQNGVEYKGNRNWIFWKNLLTYQVRFSMMVWDPDLDSSKLAYVH